MCYADSRTDYYVGNSGHVEPMSSDGSVVVVVESSHEATRVTYAETIFYTVDRSHIGSLMDIGRPKPLLIKVSIYTIVVKSTEVGVYAEESNISSPDIKLWEWTEVEWTVCNYSEHYSDGCRVSTHSIWDETE